jgi:hypothetical protein
MIDPPTQAPGREERRVELEQAVEYAIQLLLEEARSVGWTSAEFLTAIMDAADARLSTLEEQPPLDVPAQDDTA